MSQPRRDTVAGRTYLDLRARARREQRPTDELLVLYVLERFLYRLSQSAHRDRLILKGGMLLAAFDQRRPTRDIDLLAMATTNDIDTIAALVRDVAGVVADDGVVFEPDHLTAQSIRQQDVYSAVRITMPASVDRARHPLRVDVNVGDPVTPAPIEVDYPTLLGAPFRLMGYPIETVLAEKIITMVDRGDATTRERDFADVALLAGRYDIDANRLSAAVAATAAYRDTELRPLEDVLITLGGARQTAWARFLARTGLDADLPASYEDVIVQIAEFTDPILTRVVRSGSWNSARGAWEQDA